MSSTAPESVLPRHIDPRKFAKQGVSIEGSIDLKELDRLSPLLATNEGNIYAELIFGIDEQGTRNLTGHATAEVEMVCQRCLEACPQLIHMSLNLAMIWSDDKAEHLPKTWDPWIVGEGATDIYQIVEDELILSLPIVAYHSEECVPQELFSSKEKSSERGSVGYKKLDEQEQQTDKPNPFQVLEQLKGSFDEVPDNTEPETRK